MLPEPWRAAFLPVPRELFIPEVIWREDGDDLVPLRRSEQPAEWLAQVYGLRYVITQVDNGAPAGSAGRGRMATSSASRPDIVALIGYRVQSVQKQRRPSAASVRRAGAGGSVIKFTV
ncbi:MAG TPA: hypothetical protein VFO16_13840 [Pseudonocardiaceae bacterium]|nr:hypothetical protein [Pseudonocardiaceae bacterium]